MHAGVGPSGRCQAYAPLDLIVYGNSVPVLIYVCE